MEHPTKTLPAVSELSPERRLLWEAANLIEQRGWGQGDGLRDPKTGHCIATALNRACDDGRWFNPALDRVKLAIGASSADDVYAWNDAPGRTADEVTRLLRDCAVSS